MKRTILSLFCSSLVFSFGVYHADSAWSQTGYRFAYLVFSEVFQAQLGVIDPNNLQASAEYRDLPLPPDWRPPAVRVVSPNGEWGAFISASRAGNPRELQFMRLVNFISGETRDFEPGSYHVGSRGLREVVAWSPDSRQVAFNVLRETSDIFIYSLADGSTVNLTNDGFFHPYFAWSPDSTRVATFSENCLTAQNCTSSLDILNVLNRSREASLDLIDLAPAAAGLGCELRWSPDSQYLSFAPGCEYTTVESPKEVYVWDLTTGEATNATNFTLETHQRGGPLYLQGLYRTTWYDAQNLLIGATYQTNPNTARTTTTLDYRLPEGEAIPLFDDMIEEWALNPTTNQVAARRIVSEGDNGTFNGNVQIVTLDPSGDSLNAASNDFPLGCDLDWSPDGAVLAYTVTATGHCSSTIQQITFVDGTTGASQTYTPLLEDGETPYGISPIGWVAG